MHEHSEHTSQPSDGAAAADDALDTLFWRDEILQVIYWMRGEELQEAVTVQDLLIFLAGDRATVQRHLELAVVDGYLQKSPGTEAERDATRYTLTDLGRKEGGRRFRDEFAGMQKSGHGECSADCACHTTGDHAHCPSHGHAH